MWRAYERVIVSMGSGAETARETLPSLKVLFTTGFTRNAVVHNGVLDADEPSDVTSADGTYTITGINLGTWKVKEVAQTGWTCSFPSPCYHQETFLSGGTYPDNDFGNWRPATKSGTKYEDPNADGVLTDGVAVPGWTIYLLNAAGTKVLDETKTGDDGVYSFTGLKPGSYLVCEAAVEGWTQSAPANGAWVVLSHTWPSSTPLDASEDTWFCPGEVYRETPPPTSLIPRSRMPSVLCMRAMDIS